MTATTQLEQLCVNTQRAFFIGTMRQAQPGHPSTPMDARQRPSV